MSRYIQDVELTYILLRRERSCNCFIYVYICVYIYQNSSWFLFFAHSTQTIFSQSHLHFWNIFSFIQQSVCEQKHETNFVYVTKNRDLSISLIIQLPKVCLTIRNTSKKHSNYQKETNTTYNCSKCDHAPSIF